MSKFNLLEEVKLFSDKLSITQIIGLGAVFFYLHILGIRENIEPVGFVFNNPINAGYVLTDITLAFAWAYLFEVTVRMIFVGIGEVTNLVKAKWKREKPKILVSGESDFDYAYDAWKNRIILTIVFYAWFVWIFGFVAIISISIVSFLIRRFKKPKPKPYDDRYDHLNDDEYQMLGTYWKRSLLGVYIVMACMLAYGVGLVRIDHLKFQQPTIIAFSQGTEYEGQIIYSLSSSYVLYDNENDRYIVLPHNETVIQEPSPQISAPTGSDGALEQPQ